MKASGLIVLFVISISTTAALVVSGPGHAGGLVLQSLNNKSLDIERYPNQPLELVSMSIGGHSVETAIKQKTRFSDAGRDTVTFKESRGWHRKFWARLRNISGHPIYGLSGNLKFRPPNANTVFTLPLSHSRRSKSGPLQPGDEIDFTVNDFAANITEKAMREYAVDPDLSLVTFSIEHVNLGPDLQWSKGHLFKALEGHEPQRSIRAV